MTLHLTAKAAKDGAGTTITGGVNLNDESGAGTGPFDIAHVVIDSTQQEILGTTADAVVAAGAAGSLSAKLRAISRDIVANIVLAAGSAILGKVGIDQTTPGTTNKVSIGTDGTVGINAALPTGTNSVGQVTANAGTNLNTSLLALETGGNLTAISATTGAKTDAKNTATDTTSVSAMSVWKQISASVQSLVTGTTLAAGSAIVGKISAVDSGGADVSDTVNHAIKVNVVAGGAGGGAVTIASAAVASGAYASGSVVDGALVTIGAKADAKSTATDTTAISAISIWKQISASVQSLVTGTVLAAGSAIVGKMSLVDSGGADATDTANHAIKVNVVAGGAGGGAVTVASGAVASGAYASGSVVDGALVTIGAKADSKNSATDTTAVSAMSVWKQISASVQTLAGGLTTLGQAVMASSQPVVIASNQSAVPVSQSGTWTIQPGNTANTTAWKVDNSAVNQPMINGASTYITQAASTAITALSGGGGGATGDYLSHVTVIPTTTSPGVVTITDGSTAIYSFPGGASSISNLVPFTIAVQAKSSTGAWKLTTGAGLSCVAVGKFT